MSDTRKIYVVDDNEEIRDSMHMLLESAGFAVRGYASAAQFLADPFVKHGCVIADIRMPDMSGLELQEEIVKRGLQLPVIIITGHGDVPLAVRAMQAGAIDFIEKPFEDERILASIEKALTAGRRANGRAQEVQAAKDTLALLTPRERSVLACLVKGQPNKVAAHELGISPRTIEIHRAHIMDKMKPRNLSDLVRVTLAAEGA